MSNHLATNLSNQAEILLAKGQRQAAYAKRFAAEIASGKSNKAAAKSAKAWLASS